MAFLNKKSSFFWKTTQQLTFSVLRSHTGIRFARSEQRPLAEAQQEDHALNELSSDVILALQLPVRNADGTRGWLTKEINASVGQTLLDVAQTNNLNVNGTCAGDLNCSTCHCVLGNQKVFEESETISPLTKQEEDLLDSAWDVQSTSRLSCKVPVTNTMNGMSIRFPNILEGQLFKDTDTENNATLKQAKISFPEVHQGVFPEDLDKVNVDDINGNSFVNNYNERGNALRVNFDIDAEVFPRKKFQNITKSSIRKIFEKHAPGNQWLQDNVEKFECLAEVLPFRSNNYVVEELIDWRKVPNDPIFQLVFPQPGMLDGGKIDVSNIMDDIQWARRNGIKGKPIREMANKIRATLNPHPAKQQILNVPIVAGNNPEKGIQHKYREIALFFPSESQYCHSYCTYCFRWAQFVGSEGLQFASNNLTSLLEYLRANKNVQDLLVTGGDPMVMNSKQLQRYLMPIAEDPELDHLKTIRIGSKSLAYWPYKYVNEDDSNDVLQVFKDVVDAGKHVSFMAHFTHPVELRNNVVREAIRRIQSTGAIIRAQSPVVRHINDSSDLWAEMWREEIRLGIIPYYMFIERDTGAHQHFGMPLERTLEIYSGAIQQSSGLARTARGPTMATPAGKVGIMGIETIREEKVFIFKFLQSRIPAWQGRVFFAKYDADATFFDTLKPAFGEDKFFFEEEHDAIENLALQGKGSSGQFLNN